VDKNRECGISIRAIRVIRGRTFFFSAGNDPIIIFDGETFVRAEEAGVVTSEEAEGAVAGEAPAGVEPCKRREINDLEMETGAMRELMSDVTREVTPEGASHEFAAAC
jgi:hypothetical protein